jgi:hypothetical protein
MVLSSTAIGQTISTTVPKDINKAGKYLFYLHGGVVTVLGNNAINQSVPEWGPYEYLNILDSLRKRGFNVISENRKEGVDDTAYAEIIAKQIHLLLKADVRQENILLVGASAGANIVLHVANKMKRDKMKFVIMGGCWPDTYKDYLDLELYGRFLSLIETSDPHGTCNSIFEGRKHISSYQEVKLNTGLSHGFLYKGHKEWIDPMVNWFEKVK